MPPLLSRRIKTAARRVKIRSLRRREISGGWHEVPPFPLLPHRYRGVDIDGRGIPDTREMPPRGPVARSN